MQTLGWIGSIVAVALMTGTGHATIEPLALAGTIPLPGVEGRIDHLAVDLSAGRLYVAALGNNTVEVLDLRAGRHVRSIPGFREPQGIAVVPESSAVVVTNGQGPGAEFRTGDDLHLVRSVTLGDDADNVRIDAAAHRVYVGYGDGAIAALRASDGQKIGDTPVGGHPESFQLEASGPRLFVNVPTARHISVIDRVQMKVIATWPVSSASANYPMALDEAGHRLFVGCRRPAVVLVFDTATGQQTSQVEVSGDTDDLFWDVRRQQLYVTAGEGFVDVVKFVAGKPQRTAHLASAPGARTSLFVPTLNRLYVAVPHRGSQPAQIRLYDVRDDVMSPE